MKIALVKQDIYQDLYVCGSGTAPEAMLESTIMRIGPLGLFTLFGSDFFIVKMRGERECGAYRRNYSPPREVLRQLRTRPIKEITGEVFDYLEPRSTLSHADFSVEAESVDWGRYDIVISINVSVPTSIVRSYPKTLWCYMMGEAVGGGPFVEYGYDARLSQDITGNVAGGLGPVDFPYTFLGPSCLEGIARSFCAIPSEKRGVYAEINSTLERPVVRAPQLEFVGKLGHELVLHHQDIVTNLQRVATSKYFVKLGGRKIRGNSIIEAISAGTLVLMDPKDAMGGLLLPKDAWIHGQADIEARITEFDRDPDRYRALLEEERRRVSNFVVDAPMEGLLNCLDHKRRGGRPARSSLVGIARNIKRDYL